MSMCFYKALQLTFHSSWRQLKTFWDCRFFNDFFRDAREHIPRFFGVFPSPVWCTESCRGLATMRISRFLGGMCHVWRHWSGDSATCENLVAQTIHIAGTTLWLWPEETYTCTYGMRMNLSIRADMHIAVVMLNIHYLLSDMYTIYLYICILHSWCTIQYIHIYVRLYTCLYVQPYQGHYIIHIGILYQHMHM